MLIIFLILGVLLGGASVVFILQNITPVTVSFFSWQIEGSLATILFLALASGILMSMLLLFPSFIRDEFRLSKLRRENKRLEDELAETKTFVVGEVPPFVSPRATEEPAQ
ncbi:LapA family protein [Acetobacteraceae bacterium]|nr:LapA family protein [Candidatus Parcubacteria bacterium]